MTLQQKKALWRRIIQRGARRGALRKKYTKSNEWKLYYEDKFLATVKVVDGTVIVKRAPRWYEKIELD